MEFQRGLPVLGDFLSEAIIEHSPRTTSSFNECIILATICGRILFQGQQYRVRCVYEDVAMDWSDQYQWLDGILTKRLHVLSQYYPLPTETCDPKLLFANIMGQATVVYLCKGVESVCGPNDAGRALLAQYQHKALTAAEQIVNLAKALTESHLFKASLWITIFALSSFGVYLPILRSIR